FRLLNGALGNGETFAGFGIGCSRALHIKANAKLSLAQLLPRERQFGAALPHLPRRFTAVEHVHVHQYPGEPAAAAAIKAIAVIILIPGESINRGAPGATSAREHRRGRLDPLTRTE